VKELLKHGEYDGLFTHVESLRVRVQMASHLCVSLLVHSFHRPKCLRLCWLLSPEPRTSPLPVVSEQREQDSRHLPQVEASKGG